MVSLQLHPFVLLSAPISSFKLWYLERKHSSKSLLRSSTVLVSTECFYAPQEIVYFSMVASLLIHGHYRIFLDALEFLQCITKLP